MLIGQGRSLHPFISPESEQEHHLKHFSPWEGVAICTTAPLGTTILESWPNLQPKINEEFSLTVKIDNAGSRENAHRSRK